ncbi:MAG TPA: hypothetical protein VK151_06630 [Fluviicola sp.]|nr:hypothetical protein [Fluviicola sp.]
MKTLNFDKDKPHLFNGKSFFTLGSLKAGEMNASQLQVLNGKLNREIKSDIPSTWGTIGWAYTTDMKFKGSVDFSENGNFSSNGKTLEVVKEIYSINPFLNNQDIKVNERFINFNNLKLGGIIDFDRPNELPDLRLTVFLKPDEGALTFMQFSDTDDHNDPDAEVIFVMPEETGDKDRKTFLIPLYNAKERSTVLDIVGKTKALSFIVKVLTYKLGTGSPQELIEQAKEKLRTSLPGKGDSRYQDDVGDYIFGREKYSIKKYTKAVNTTANTGGYFTDIDQLPIDYSKNTLLLIHGTFATTKGTFGKLYLDLKNQGCLLNELLDAGIFEQIIAFDHPTVSENAKDNLDWFLNKIKGNKFAKPISILSASRGALVAKRFSSSSHKDIIPVKKVMMFSGANGVGWFNTGAKIATLLSIWKKLTPGVGGKVILAFFQFSADFFLKQKACVEMKPGTNELKDLLAMNPQAECMFFNVISDWDKELANDKKHKVFSIALDFAIRGSLGEEHDWVVGLESQKLYFSHGNYRSKQPVRIKGVHCRYFDKTYAKPVTHPIIQSFFAE